MEKTKTLQEKLETNSKKPKSEKEAISFEEYNDHLNNESLADLKDLMDKKLLTLDLRTKDGEERRLVVTNKETRETILDTTIKEVIQFVMRQLGIN